eukprot:478291-Prymnesium_polylepis.1
MAQERCSPLHEAPLTDGCLRFDPPGRLINAYAPDDAQLSLLYRSNHLASMGCCGAEAVRCTRVENVDTTSLVPPSSESYHFAIPAILDEVGLLR